ncbi:MAG: hypothetical protein AAFR17_15025 [Pseudomonadota bacterium]
MVTVTTDRPPRFDFLSTGPVAEEQLGVFLRLGMAVAILSVVFEKVLDAPGNLETERYHLIAATVGMALATGLVLFERVSRIGIAFFAVSILVYVGDKWAAYHNHGWLTVWTIPAALAFGAAWWQSGLYRWYLRATLGVVMLAAVAQKLLAGTYLDGTYITFLSQNGSTTERMFGFLCDASVAAPCFAHKAIGTFIVAWQAVVGVLLLAGVRSLAFLFIEIAFLLGAGLYADEMNFQVLNIALLCIAFGYGMRPWLCAICLTLLVVDTYSIAGLLNHVL